MSLYILDTDILSLYQHGNSTVESAVKAHAADDLAISVISVEEQLSGWYKLIRRANKHEELAAAYERLARAVSKLARLTVLPFSVAAIKRWEQLKKLKLNVAKPDLRIAAIVLEHHATLVTRNDKDFQRVPGLLIENWVK